MTDRTVVPPIVPDEPYEGIRVVGRSDVGCVREENQDFMGWFQAGPRQLLVVCDGMGGHKGGYEASRVAVAAIGQVFAEDPTRAPRELLDAAIVSANERVRASAAENPELRGMGSTAVAVLVEGVKCWIAHVGDSRAYLIRAGRPERLTRDHTQVNRMVVAGLIEPHEAEDHPLGHILDRSVGSSPQVEVEVAPEPLLLEPHDRVMLCSDGYCGVVRDHEMRPHFAPGRDLDESVRAAIELALARGAPDNTTVAALLVVSEEPAPQVEPLSPPPPYEAEEPEHHSEMGPEVKALLAAAVLLTAGIAWWAIGQV
ncbi:MAG: serine/threonine-protein phosphatase [Proteobacteria bacterium]|nr:serine/threonine-protein phosphatase [Pseudomonadota bacterium]MCP4915390.1 serine/threonine-protein phosphatase [Pseudomonadota bacterium]